MNLLQKPITSYEKELSTELKNARQQLADLRRQIIGLERDNRLLSVMSENADRMRRMSDSDRRLQFLYNHLILATCPNLVFLFDADLHLQLASESCFGVLPFDNLDDMRHRTPEQLFAKKIEAGWIENISATCREAMESRQSRHYSGRVYFIDGAGHMDIHANIDPVVDEESGVLRGVMLSMRDVTEISVTKEIAEDVSRSKSSFLVNMGHEIRTPINAIKGLAELAMMTDLDELQKSYVGNIVSSSNSLLAVISDILDFSEIDSKTIEILKSEYSLATILKDVCGGINQRAVEKGLAFESDIAPSLPDKLYGDDSRLKQVMLNVLGNAVKYTQKGSILFKVSGERLDDETISLRCEVSDTGQGIRHDELPGLFESFNRRDLRLDGNNSGTSLGLVISKQLMLAMQGDIDVRSVYGKGSTFSFWLPQKVLSPVPIADIKEREKKKLLILDEDERGRKVAAMCDRLGVARVSLRETRDQALQGWEDASHCIYYDGYDLSSLGKLRGSMPDSAFVVIRDIRRASDKSKFADTTIYEPILINDLATALNLKRGSGFGQALQAAADTGNFMVQNARALIVDDNSVSLAGGSELLQSFGFEVMESKSGSDAVKMCQAEEFDIIFMDHMMPVMDGLQAAKYIRESAGKNNKTPMVVLTANTVSGMQDYFVRCGMDDMVSKPIEAGDLSRAVMTWLPQSKISKGRVAESATAVMAPDFDLVKLLDDFGMYANDVMRELDGDLQAFIARLGNAGASLGDMVRHLNELVRLEDWPRFSRVIGELKELLHGVGARDCAVRAKKMEIASSEGNVAYVHQDFKSLMGNMYMLERKLDALMPMVMGKKHDDYVPNDPVLIYTRLQELQVAIENHDGPAAGEAIEDIARCSFDHDLDMQLNGVRWALEDNDFDEARRLNVTAVAFYKQRNAIPALRA